MGGEEEREILTGSADCWEARKRKEPERTSDLTAQLQTEDAWPSGQRGVTVSFRAG